METSPKAHCSASVLIQSKANHKAKAKGQLRLQRARNICSKRDEIVGHLSKALTEISPSEDGKLFFLLPALQERGTALVLLGNINVSSSSVLSANSVNTIRQLPVSAKEEAAFLLMAEEPYFG